MTRHCCLALIRVPRLHLRFPCVVKEVGLRGPNVAVVPLFWAFFAFSGGDVFLKLWSHVRNSFPHHLSSLVTKTVLAGGACFHGLAVL